jgi:hypothetical protein
LVVITIEQDEKIDKENNMPQEMPIPAPAYDDPESAEVARIWIANGQQVVSLVPAFEDPEAWGMMLVDLARHVAGAYEAHGHKKADVLRKIHSMFMAEWEHPTDEAKQVRKN